jgi:hypothetical protein
MSTIADMVVVRIFDICPKNLTYVTEGLLHTYNQFPHVCVYLQGYEATYIYYSTCELLTYEDQ